MEGQTVSHYQIKEKLGGGGMGVVYLAEDTRLERSVAIKFLPPAYFEDDQAVKRFQREAKAAAALNHPHICTVHDIGEADGQPYLVMEHLEGETLKHKVEKGPLPTAETLKLAVQIADALQIAHQKGIIHRDIKPANIFVTERGDAKVLDFGLAKQLGKQAEGEEDLTTALKRAGTTLGTLNYMSPEQVKGEVLDPRTDIFSLGVVTYELVTGLNPFRRTTSGETVSSILNDDPPPLSRYTNEAPEALQHILRRMLAKDPKRRSQSMHGVRNDLEQLVEDSGRAPLASSRKISRWAWLAAIPALVLVGFLGFYWDDFSRSESERATDPQLAQNAPSGPMIPVPFTSNPGFEDGPDFSPDGDLVVFSWNGNPENPITTDIYVKRIGPGEALRLTSDPGQDRHPAWSPDSQWIAFTRNQTEIVLVPPLGGAERKLADVVGPRLSMGIPGGLTWSADSKWIVTADKDPTEGLQGLFLISVESGEKTRLTSTEDPVEDFNPAFSPDGRRLAFVRGTMLLGEVYVLELGEDLVPRAEPKPVTDQGGALWYPAWTANGRELVYTSGEHAWLFRLWRIDASGAGEAELLEFAEVGALYANVSRQGNRLVYGQISVKSNIWSIEEGGATSGFVTSTYYDSNPRYSPNGSKVAFESERAGSHEIWVSDSDGGNAVQLTKFGRGHSSAPGWSPDGQSIVFDSNAEGTQDIYVINSNGGKPRRLTDGTGVYVVPSWSRDGQWIYFCKVGDTNQIWRIPVDGGEADQVTKNGGGVAFESVDGKHLYFTRTIGMSALWRLPLAGGEETKVLESLVTMGFRPFEDGIFYMAPPDAAGANAIRFLDFATGQSKDIVKIEESAPGGRYSLAVSSDRKTFLYTQQEGGSDLMLVENFH